MPDWAKFRAVFMDGSLFVFEDRPILTKTQFDICSQFDWCEKIGDGYDPTNWQESLEARPETQHTPELVVDAYGIKGTTVQIVAVGDEWVIKNGSRYLFANKEYTPRKSRAKTFHVPQAAAEYWMAKNEKK